MKTIVVAVEGVLRKLTDGQRINEGVALLSDLAHGSTGLIYLTSKAAAETEEWLDLNGVLYDLVLTAREDRVDQLRKIRHEWGYPVDLIIEPDPAIAGKLLREGHTVLIFAHPHYARQDWRPDHQFAVRAWEDVRGEIFGGRDLRVSDERLKGE